MLQVGCSYRNARKTKVLDTPASFYFLFRTVDDDEVLIPLTGGEGDVLLAKRWLGLSLRDDGERLDYANSIVASPSPGSRRVFITSRAT